MGPVNKSRKITPKETAFTIWIVVLCSIAACVVVSCQKNEPRPEITVKLSNPSNPEEIAQVISNDVQDKLRRAEADMGNGTPELILVNSSGNNYTYKGAIPFYSGTSSFEREITATYNGKTVAYTYDDETVAVSKGGSTASTQAGGNSQTVARPNGNTEVKSSLGTITLKIGSRDVAFYKINFSNSTMRYLGRELNMNGLEQTAYIHKSYYDNVSEYLLTINKILKGKRVFSEQEIFTIKNMFVHLSEQNQSLITETYEYRITESSFPDNKYHGLTTSIIFVELMYNMAHLYANLCITENYQIDDLQKAIKNLSTGISRDEENLFKEVFPDIVRDMLIKKFLVSTNTNTLPSVFFL